MIDLSESLYSIIYREVVGLKKKQVEMEDKLAGLMESKVMRGKEGKKRSR